MPSQETLCKRGRSWARTASRKGLERHLEGHLGGHLRVTGISAGGDPHSTVSVLDHLRLGQVRPSSCRRLPRNSPLTHAVVEVTLPVCGGDFQLTTICSQLGAFLLEMWLPHTAAPHFARNCRNRRSWVRRYDRPLFVKSCKTTSMAEVVNRRSRLMLLRSASRRSVRSWCRT